MPIHHMLPLADSRLKQSSSSVELHEQIIPVYPQVHIQGHNIPTTANSNKYTNRQQKPVNTQGKKVANAQMKE